MSDYLIYVNRKLVSSLSVQCNPANKEHEVATKAAEQYRKHPQDLISVQRVK